VLFMSQPLRILVVAPDPLHLDAADAPASEAERSRTLRIGLLENGYNIVAVLPADALLPQRIAEIRPDVVIVDAQSAARDTLEHVVFATRDERRPIVLFTDDQDTSDVKHAIAAGVTAYIVAGLAPERVRPVLEVALARFEHEEQLRLELANAREELSSRKTIDRAKTWLMEHLQVSEDEAYKRMRTTAMQKQLKLAQVAEQLLNTAELMKPT
jgi:two-component system, response regulator / RNA-binding antiterminator